MAVKLKNSGMMKVLTVSLGGQLFGIEIEDINDIIPATECTPVPGAGPRIAGLLNLRGHIITCVLVRHCLGFSQAGENRMNVIIRRPQNELYGLLFDGVSEIYEIDADAMEPIPSILDQRWQGLSRGMFRRPEGLLILLDAERVIAAAAPEESEAE